MTPPGKDPSGQVAGSLTSFRSSPPADHLKGLSLLDLSTELYARLQAGATYGSHVLLAEQLQQFLAVVVDTHENRFSACRYRDHIRPIVERLKPGELNGGTIVDLGCGSLNPFVFSFLFLMLGAQRAFAIDIEPIQDLKVAVRAMATAAAWMLLDSTRILGPPGIAPEAVLKNLQGFQLPLLATGDAAGMPASRLQHRVQSIDDLSFVDGEVDAVFSVSVLEHMVSLDDALESLARITRAGGIGYHVVDFADHRIYSDTSGCKNPFEFLKVRTFDPPEQMHWSNRIRADQICAMFARHGFAVEHVQTPWVEPLSEHEQAQFVDPYRSMDRKNLETIVARIFVRRAD
jgi:SAM-dependent methyltransferase